MAFSVILLSFYPVFGQITSASSEYKFEILKVALDTLSKINGINFKATDSNNRIDILLETKTYEVHCHGDILGWRVSLDSTMYFDTLLLNKMFKYYKTPFTDVFPFSISDVDFYINGRVGGNQFGRIYKEFGHYIGILINSPIIFGWGQLDIMTTLTLPHSGNKDEYDNANSLFRSTVICIPISIVKFEGPKPENLHVSQYLCQFHVFADGNFSSIKYTLEKVIPLGDLWRK